ncbi:hypothetical protein [Mycobacterium sp. DL592]|uniref:hypothetical protein n=1 Tax=Mycobacterium sp. DL592 TaxID=2675524 RepID=UPI001423849D|nr:hypothetical protein [Mycobacterium sp. DL592]
MATPNSVLLQSGPVLRPQNEAHEAWAAGADPNPAAAKTPAVTAPIVSALVNFVLVMV